MYKVYETGKEIAQKKKKSDTLNQEWSISFCI